MDLVLGSSTLLGRPARISMTDGHLFKVNVVNGVRLYENQHGYIHCRHTGELIPVTYRWGNTAYVCESCGEVVKKELKPGS